MVDQNKGLSYSDAGVDIDNDIVDKLTGKAAQYFANAFRSNSAA